MPKHILNMWTFCLLFCATIPILIISGPVASKNEEPKTMYEALVHKCPNLEESQLQENLKDIFTSCENWSKISASRVLLKEERNNTACLVFYDSLVSFCTKFEEQDHNIAMYKGLIPGSVEAKPIFHTFNVETICLNRGLNDTFKNALTKSEHNISHLLEPENCLFLCGELGESGIVISDICKYAFYFGTLDVNKFISRSNELHKNPSNFNKSKNELPSPPMVVQPVKTDDTNAKLNEIKDQQHDNPPNPAIGSKPQATNASGNQKPEIPGPVALVHPLNKDAPKEQHPETLNNAPLVEPQVGDDDVKRPSINKPETNAEKSQNVVKNESKGAPEAIKPVPELPVLDIPAQVPAIEDSGEAKDPDDIAGEAEPGDIVENHEEEEKAENANVDHGMPVEAEKNTLLKELKPANTVDDEPVSRYNTEVMDGDSYFFSYFTVFMCLCVVGYVGYHNRQKIFALLLEGKRGKRPGRNGRRPNSANYHKLDSNLEEAISSSCTKNASNVIY